LILTGAGLLVTLLAGVRFIAWSAANWTRITEPPADDPFGSLLVLWTAVRLPLAGMAIFAIALLWALATSIQILHRATEASTPPPIG
jgi:hypothetical protein